MRAEYHNSPEKFGYIGIIPFTNHYIGTVPKVMVSWWGCPSTGLQCPKLAGWFISLDNPNRKTDDKWGTPMT